MYMSMQICVWSDLEIEKQQQIQGTRFGSRDHWLFWGTTSVFSRKITFLPSAGSTNRGVTPLLPKDEGIGVMISAFQSREFGFGYRPLLPSELKEINKRRVGKSYLDMEAEENEGIEVDKYLGDERCHC